MPVNNTEGLWNDRVILAFLFLLFCGLWFLREIMKAEEAYNKLGEYQDLDEHERKIGE